MAVQWSLVLCHFGYSIDNGQDGSCNRQVFVVKCTCLLVFQNPFKAMIKGESHWLWDNTLHVKIKLMAKFISHGNLSTSSKTTLSRSINNFNEDTLNPRVLIYIMQFSWQSQRTIFTNNTLMGYQTSLSYDKLWCWTNAYHQLSFLSSQEINLDIPTTS